MYPCPHAGSLQACTSYKSTGRPMKNAPSSVPGLQGPSPRCCTANCSLNLQIRHRVVMFMYTNRSIVARYHLRFFSTDNGNIKHTTLSDCGEPPYFRECNERAVRIIFHHIINKLRCQLSPEMLVHRSHRSKIIQ
jgi:hypothetical protein